MCSLGKPISLKERATSRRKTSPRFQPSRRQPHDAYQHFDKLIEVFKIFAQTLADLSKMEAPTKRRRRSERGPCAARAATCYDALGKMDGRTFLTGKSDSKHSGMPICRAPGCMKAGGHVKSRAAIQGGACRRAAAAGLRRR